MSGYDRKGNKMKLIHSPSLWKAIFVTIFAIAAIWYNWVLVFGSPDLFSIWQTVMQTNAYGQQAAITIINWGNILNIGLLMVIDLITLFAYGILYDVIATALRGRFTAHAFKEGVCAVQDLLGALAGTILLVVLLPFIGITSLGALAGLVLIPTAVFFVFFLWGAYGLGWKIEDYLR